VDLLSLFKELLARKKNQNSMEKSPYFEKFYVD